MKHRVVVPFPCSWDGITLVDLAIGDERDFGSMAAGLLGVGWIEPLDGQSPIEEPEINLAIMDSPIEMAVEHPRRGRKRK